MQTLTWDGIEFGNFSLVAAIHLWNQSIEKSYVIIVFMSAGMVIPQLTSRCILICK